MPALKNSFFKIDTLPGLPQLWSKTLGNKNICIAVIDGNIDHHHACFRGANIRTANTLHAGEKVPAQSSALQHGTSVTSIIFGQHHSSVRGISPNCPGIIIPVFRNDGNNPTTCSQLDLARAIQLADEKGANIINISGGEFSPSGKSEAMLANTVEKCSKKGIIIISAVGNDGCKCLHVPAAESSVLAIGAMDESYKPLGFSNWGNAYKKNGLLFPGKDILTAAPGNRVVVKTGTSFATPVASAISGLLLSLMIEFGRKPDGRLLHEVLMKTAHRCNKTTVNDCDKTLAGSLNLPGAILEIADQCKASSFSYHIKKSAFKFYPEGLVTPSEYKPPPISINVTHTAKSNNKKKEENIMSYTEKKITPSSGFDMPELSGPDETSLNLLPASTPGSESVSLSDCNCGCQKNTSAEVQPYAAENGGTTGNGSIASSNSDNGSAASEKKTPMIVYAVGTLGYDFRTEASRDSFQQAMNANPYDPGQLLRYLDENPEANEDILWTLNLDATPIYIILPYGGFAASIYTRIREFYREQLAGAVSRISVPGMIVGKGSLLSGHELPYVMPKGHGMYSWSTSALVEAVMGAQPEATDESGLIKFNDKRESLENFLDRVYYELRNMGISPQERAINFAATNAFQIGRVFEKAAGENLELDTIDVDRSPICKQGSDCWDVKLVFFNPARRTEQARRIHRFTIDVSNIIPVTVGGIRSWNIF